MVESSIQTTSSKCLPWSKTNYLGTPNRKNDMVKEETWHRFTFAIEHGHGLEPLSEVINSHNDLFMIIGQGKVDCHEVDFPFTEGTDCDYRV